MIDLSDAQEPQRSALRCACALYRRELLVVIELAGSPIDRLHAKRDLFVMDWCLDMLNDTDK